MAPQDGEPSFVEVVQPLEELRERVDVGSVARDRLQDFARQPEKEKCAQGRGWTRGRYLEDERKEGVHRSQVASEGGQRGRGM